MNWDHEIMRQKTCRKTGLIFFSGELLRDLLMKFNATNKKKWIFFYFLYLGEY